MELGIVGLGKMGAGIARRLDAGGHRIVGFDRDPRLRETLRRAGLAMVESLGDLLERLQPGPVVWVMVPSGEAVDAAITRLLECSPGPSILIDGGNSNYRDTIRRYEMLNDRGVGFVDVGTSGGIRGEEEGYCLMIGGREDTVVPLRPVFETLAPHRDRGWGHVGPPGAGHFVKMIHNGIEYGMMQAMAEGFAVLERNDAFDLDLAGVASLWNEGSVIRCWLLELAQAVLSRNPTLDGFRSEVSDSGEGRWALAEAISLNVATPVMAQSLIARIQSRDADAFSNRILSALRGEFGGHASKATDTRA